MQKLTLFLSDYVGVDCAHVTPTAHLSYAEADKPECRVIEVTANVAPAWTVGESASGELCLYDSDNRHAELVCYTDTQGKLTSILAVTAAGMTKIAPL